LLHGKIAMVLSLIDYMPLNICDIDLFHSVLCFVQIILKLCNHTRLLIVIYSDGICVIVVVQAACERPSEASAHLPRLERIGLLLHLHTASWTGGNPPSMIICRCCIFYLVMCCKIYGYNRTDWLPCVSVLLHER
jgi:hypothetical protein